MGIIDISQEVFTCNVFPGDPQPVMTRVMSIEKGDICNLTKFEMCAHNGTHVDAPFHFENDGKTIDEVGLVPYVGDCFVAHPVSVILYPRLRIRQQEGIFFPILHRDCQDGDIEIIQSVDI